MFVRFYSNIPRCNRLFSSFCGHNCVKNNRIIYCRSFSALKTVTKMSGEVEGLDLVDVISNLKKLADINSAEKWDNVGLLVEPFTRTRIKSILLTNDLTENVMDEAVTNRVNLIISYHPPIFSPIKRITSTSWKERILAACLENKIAVYSPHTSWDSAADGVTDWLAGAFDGLFDPNSVIPIVKPTENSSVSSCLTGEESANGHVPSSSTSAPLNIGMGRILPIASTAPPPLTLAKCVELVKRRTGLVHVRLATARNRNADSPISSIALVPGSGGSLLKSLLDKSQKDVTPPIDLFLTGEMFHHDILDAVHRGVSVILTNHSDSERGFLKVVAAKLRISLGNEVRVTVSTADRDPLRTV